VPTFSIALLKTKDLDQYPALIAKDRLGRSGINEEPFTSGLKLFSCSIFGGVNAHPPL
jgi:hypothetical protein